MKTNFCRQMLSLARSWGNRLALVNSERNRQFTYKELHLLSNKIANMLKDDFDIRRGDSYFCILKNDNLSLLHVWTVFKGEASCAFTNYRDAMDEHKSQIDRVKPKLVFIEAELVKSYYDFLIERDIIIVTMDPPPEGMQNVHYFWDVIENASDRETDVEHDIDNDILLYRFTGGTTGKGKCAMYSIRNWEQNRAISMEMEDPMVMGTRFLHLAPLSHGAGMFTYPALFLGGTQVTMNTADLLRFCEIVESEKIDATTMVPTLLYRLLEIEEAENHDLSSLKTLYYGAAPMSPGKLVPLQKRFGNIFVQVYGSTEHLGFATTLCKDHHKVQSDADLQRLASVGTVTPGCELIIVGEDGRELPFGQLGEIWIRSPAVISGYLNSPEETENEFEKGWWKSGDIGKMDEDGFVYIVDRKKDVINSGGYNVYAAEVEAVVNSHPSVLMSAVIGRPHKQWGEAVHAEIILKNGVGLNEDEIVAFCKMKLAKYKAPKTVLFVKELPLSSAQKVLRRKIREKYW